MVTFDELKDQARNTPVISPLPRLSSFYLDGCDIYTSVREFHNDLYNPDHIFDNNVVINADSHHPDYPRMVCDEITVSPELNSVVDWADDDHHDRLQQELLVQSDLKQHLLETITSEEVVVLIIIDGLSYETIRKADITVQPVYVDGISTTGPGYRRVIYGHDSISPMSVYGELLNNKEFYDTFGFTYWERGQEELSTDLHAAMGDNVYRISDFDEAIEVLADAGPITEKTFVQITRMGMDQDSHNRKEKPNKTAVRDEIISDLSRLYGTISRLSDHFRIFVTADHGILWRDQLPTEPPIVTEEYHNHARYIEDEGNIEEGRVIWGPDDMVTTGLVYPYLTRELENTEWGVHGGFSYYESIVPLIELAEGDSV